MISQIVQQPVSASMSETESPILALGSFAHEKPLTDGDLTLLGQGFFRCDDSIAGEDTGVQALRAYRREGYSFLKKLRGSFALALWDANEDRLLLATDHFGTRSLYFWIQGERLAFAPRLRSLVAHPRVPRRIDENALYFYLNHSFIPAPETIYRSVNRLEPGHCLIWEKGKTTIRRYWDVSYPEDSRLDENTAAELVKSSVEESIGFLLRNGIGGHKPGAFLSGGTDSSTVVGLLTRIGEKTVDSFSVGFDESPYNEIGFARIAAERFGSRLHECFVRPQQAFDELPSIARAFDEPFGNSSAVPTYFCLKTARDAGVEVMFTGDGGDEIYGGNERYLTENLFSYYQRFPHWMRRAARGIAPVLPAVYPLEKVKNYVRKAELSPAERFFEYQLYYRDHAREFFTDDFYRMLDHDFPVSLPQKQFERAGEAHWLNRLLYVDLKLAISDNDLFKVNRTAEACGIEIRYPYLDKEVAAASGRIPAALKLKGWEKRYIFKKAFSGLLPTEILKKKKHGFGLPTGEWLRAFTSMKCRQSSCVAMISISSWPQRQFLCTIL